MKRKFKIFLLILLSLSFTACGGIRRTYTVRGEAEKVKFEYRDSVQQFNTLKK